MRRRLSSLTIPAATASAAAIPAATPAAAAAWRRWALRLTLGTLVGAPLLKTYLALHPILSPPQKEPAAVSSLPLSLGPVLHTTPLRWGWLLSEASDRLIRDVFVAATIVRDYVEHREQADWSEVHQRGADRLLKLCQVNRGIYIKLGQHIGQLEYLLPREYVSTLKVMCSAAPEDTFEQVERVFRQEFGVDLDAVFSSVERAPIASASLAQVHVGVLRAGGDGRRVAIKVQHEGLRETAAADIHTVAALVAIVKALFPRFDFGWLADEVRVNLPMELDFRIEADNAVAAAAAFAHRPDVVIPRVFKQASSARVLTMSFEEGVYADRVREEGGGLSSPWV